MLSKEKAASIAKSVKKGYKILKIIDRGDSYIIDMVPVGYNESMGMFCDGAVIVDKKTRKVSTYNPLIN